MKDILNYDGQKLFEILQVTVVIHEVGHFMNDSCESHHSQIPTILRYGERQLCHKPDGFLAFLREMQLHFFFIDVN